MSEKRIADLTNDEAQMQLHAMQELYKLRWDIKRILRAYKIWNGCRNSRVWTFFGWVIWLSSGYIFFELAYSWRWIISGAFALLIISGSVKWLTFKLLFYAMVMPNLLREWLILGNSHNPRHDLFVEIQYWIPYGERPDYDTIEILKQALTQSKSHG